MPSAFGWVVKSVIRELGSQKDLVAVDSLESASSFQPYHLLTKRLSCLYFGRSRYKPLNLSIQDILEGDGPKSLSPPVPKHVSTLRFSDLVDGHLEGSVKLPAAGQGMVKAGASVSNSCNTSVHVAKLQVDPRTWMALQQETHVQTQEPSILKHLRCHGVNVYVVTEALRMEEEVEATRTHKHEGSGQLALLGALSLQGKGQGHLSTKTTVSIPSGSILAFRVGLLVIDSGTQKWEIVLSPKKKQKTFRRSQADSSNYTSRSLTLELSDRVTMTEAVAVEGFALLKAEAEEQAEGLCVLSQELCAQLLRGLEAVLQDHKALEALEESLECGMCSGHVAQQDGPVGAILECLVTPARELEVELTRHAVYLLGALSALNSAQRLLLAQESQANALNKPLSLVRYLLQQTDPGQQCREVTLPPELRGRSWGAGDPAWVLLEQCGLQLQDTEPQVHWVPRALDAVHALYASLVLLSSLSQEQ